MDIGNYSYLWQDYNNVLVKSKLGYSIVNVNKKEFRMYLIENEKIMETIIKEMLQNGNPIYESIEDLKNNRSPINIIGQPSEAEDFPIKRYKLAIQWTKSVPISIQVKNLKVTFPVVNVISSQELIKIAKGYGKWYFDVEYLDEVEKNKILEMAKERQLNIKIELDDLREMF